jgi:adenylate cyclase class 2
MQTEIEVKFLNVDHSGIRALLKEKGAVLVQPERLMKRVVIDYPDRRMQKAGNTWLRIRDEGNKITMTLKTSEENVFGGATEIETTVGDYQKTIDIFIGMGLEVCTDQETRRETWELNGAEVVLDEWPWLNTFIEIEAETEEIVKETAKLLGFDWDDAIFGSVTTAYRVQYPLITKDEHISTIPEIKFGHPRPEWFTKGKE